MSSANLLFFSLLLVGPFISVSSSNWIICWSGVELSFLGLIPLLFMNNKYVSLTKESSMKYFCIQALGSGLLFYSGLMVFSDLSSEFNLLLFVLSIFLKLGVFPMHFWVPSVCAGLDYMSLYFVLTFQKIAPFAFLNLIISELNEEMIMVTMVLGGLTSLVGAIMGNNQTDIRSMLGCSSIVHSGWLVLGCLTGYFWGYFFIYCASLMIVFLFINKPESLSEVGVGILSLSGLPPFFMFLGKWGVLKTSLELYFPFWSISLFMVGAIISLVFYLKFSYSFLLNSWASSWEKSNNTTTMFFLMFNLFVLFIFFCV
uniref:NADH-ubiquinone oxidoreductase chain 2 n=1 Tax=Elysia timida TaxID=154625 RepID=A0A342LD57_ELYTI|nr:NADH dehydrogenase subunit 2 [Elysia timida]ANP26542.1 NADH dehydrogenase subunit 2 [Elysia timida]